MMRRIYISNNFDKQCKVAVGQKPSIMIQNEEYIFDPPWTILDRFYTLDWLNFFAIKCKLIDLFEFYLFAMRFWQFRNSFLEKHLRFVKVKQQTQYQYSRYYFCNLGFVIEEWYVVDFLCLKVNKHTNIDSRYLVNTYLCSRYINIPTKLNTISQLMWFCLISCLRDSKFKHDLRHVTAQILCQVK